LKEHIFLPKSYAKEETQTSSGETWQVLKISFDVESLRKFAWDNETQKGMLHVEIKKRRFPDSAGNTHIVTLNQYRHEKEGKMPRVEDEY
jgi:hypothetical protein